MTVSCRRSASRGAPLCCAGSAVATLTRWPHPPQNSSPGSLMNPHPLHARDSAAPHFEPKRRPSRFLRSTAWTCHRDGSLSTIGMPLLPITPPRAASLLHRGSLGTIAHRCDAGGGVVTRMPREGFPVLRLRPSPLNRAAAGGPVAAENSASPTVASGNERGQVLGPRGGTAAPRGPDDDFVTAARR